MLFQPELTEITLWLALMMEEVVRNQRYRQMLAAGGRFSPRTSGRNAYSSAHTCESSPAKPMSVSWWV